MEEWKSGVRSSGFTVRGETFFQTLYSEGYGRMLFGLTTAARGPHLQVNSGLRYFHPSSLPPFQPPNSELRTLNSNSQALGDRSFTTSTGHRACSATRSAVLPRSNRLIALQPWEPIITRSTSGSFAINTISSRGLPNAKIGLSFNTPAQHFFFDRVQILLCFLLRRFSLPSQLIAVVRSPSAIAGILPSRLNS
jgi:hypothetical protein